MKTMNSNLVAALGLLLSVLVGCQTREIREPLPGAAPNSVRSAIERAETTGQPQLIFSDDFERASLGTAWRRGSGEGGEGRWRIEDGWLVGDDLHNDPLWLVQRLPEKVRVEFDAQADSSVGDLKVEIFGDGRRHASGYVLIFGGWNNRLDVIARLDEHGADRLEHPSRRVQPGRRYRMAVERGEGGTLRWRIDGQPFLEYEDAVPLRGADQAYFAFSNWEAPVRFDNFRVYALP